MQREVGVKLDERAEKETIMAAFRSLTIAFPYAPRASKKASPNVRADEDVRAVRAVRHIGEGNVASREIICRAVRALSRQARECDEQSDMRYWLRELSSEPVVLGAMEGLPLVTGGVTAAAETLATARQQQAREAWNALSVLADMRAVCAGREPLGVAV